MSSSSIVCNFIDSYIVAGAANTALHAYRQMQLFKILFPAFLEHCGHDKELVTDADWAALFEFLLMVAEEPVKDEEDERQNGAFKGTLLSLRYRRLSAMDAMSCLSDSFTKGHRSRCRVFTLMQGRVAEKIATKLDVQYRMKLEYKMNSEARHNNKSLTNLFSGSSSATAMQKNTDAINEQQFLLMTSQRSDEAPENNHQHLQQSSSLSIVKSPSHRAQAQVSFIPDPENNDSGNDEAPLGDVFGDDNHNADNRENIRRRGPLRQLTSSIVSIMAVENKNWNSNSNSNSSHQLRVVSPSASSSTTSSTLTQQERPRDTTTKSSSNVNINRDATLTEVTTCESVTDDMLLAASSTHSIQVTVIAGGGGSGGGSGGSLDLWYFSLDAVPAKMLGSISEAEYVAIEMWFNALPRDIVAPAPHYQQHHQLQSDAFAGAALATSQVRAMVTDGLLKGLPGLAQPLTVANVKSLAPRVYETAGGGVWKFDCRLLDEWLNYFPRGSGTLADVLAFLYRDTPRQFIVRRIEGQCLAVPPNSDAWPSDAFYCGQLVVPIQQCPPASSPPALRLSHVSTRISSSASVADSAATANYSTELDVFGGGGSGVFRIPAAHVAALSVITFLRIGVNSSNRKEFLTALKAWFDAVDFANLGYMTLFSLQTTMMRFREPPTSPILVEDDDADDDDDEEQHHLQHHQQQQHLAGFTAFGSSSISSQQQQQPHQRPPAQHYEKCPFLEKASFRECVEKSQELVNKGSAAASAATTSSSSSVFQQQQLQQHFSSLMQSLCDVEMREVFQFAVTDVVKKLLQESFHQQQQQQKLTSSARLRRLSLLTKTKSTKSAPSTGGDKEVKGEDLVILSSSSVVAASAAAGLSCSSATQQQQEQQQQQQQLQQQLSTSLQVLTGETLHVFKPPQGTVITAAMKLNLVSSSSPNNAATSASSSSSQHQTSAMISFAIAQQHAINATEAFVSQSPELHRPVTFELFARAFVEVAGLIDSCSSHGSGDHHLHDDGCDSNSNLRLTELDPLNESKLGKNLVIVHPAVLAEVLNVSTLRTMRRRNLKHLADDKFNALVAEYQASVADAAATAAGAAAGGGGAGSGFGGGTTTRKTSSTTTSTSASANRKTTSSTTTAVTSSSASSGKKMYGGAFSSSSSSSNAMMITANGPVSFTITGDQRHRLRRRIESCLACLEGVGFLLVVTNVRAHIRIQKRLAQLATSADCVDEKGKPTGNNRNEIEENIPLGRSRRSFTRSKSAAQLQRRRSSAFGAGFSSVTSHPDLLLMQSSQMSSGTSTSTFFPSQQNLDHHHQLNKIMQLDRLFDPTNTTDTILQHLDASGIPIDFFVNEPSGVYRRLPALLLSGSSKVKVFRDIGYWSSSKRRIPISKCQKFTQFLDDDGSSDNLLRSRREGEEKGHAAEATVTTRKRTSQQPEGEVIVMTTSIPAGLDVAYRFHFEGYNESGGSCAINTIVCGREGRKGNALVSGIDHVTCDVDVDRTPSISVLNFAGGIEKVTAKLVSVRKRSYYNCTENNNEVVDNNVDGDERHTVGKCIAFELHSPTGCWSVAGFSVSLAVVSELYGAGFLCGVSFDVVAT